LTRQIEQADELARRFAARPQSFTDEEIAARAVPAWLQKEASVPKESLRCLQGEPPLWLRAKRGSVEQVISALGAIHPADFLLPEALEYRGETDLFSTEEYKRGLFELQDISSQAVGYACAPKAGQSWWDACAGEGGKTLHLSDLMENKGLIWASDRADWRLQKLKRRTARAGVFNYRAALWDGSAKLPTRTQFDGILVDAPCSGTGTWQRNPHARWTATPQDVQELAALQRRLLGHVVSLLKRGGKLVYSVCTLTKAETSEIASWLTEQHPHLKPLSAPNPLYRDAPAAAEHWLWPHESGGNGMYIAVWCRD
jgi:16S rRNA (cytosine967-C5)-methyltransferase